jgi:hypothetical protein
MPLREPHDVDKDDQVDLDAGGANVRLERRRTNANNRLADTRVKLAATQKRTGTQRLGRKHPGLC